MKKLLFAAFMTFAAGLSTNANAVVFSGGTVDFQYYAYGGPYIGFGSPTTIITPGSAIFSPYFNVSVAGNQIVYTYLSDTLWSSSVVSLNSGGLYIDNGSLISSVLGVPAFTSVTLDAGSMLGTSGFTAANLTWNSGAIAVSWQNLSFHTGDTVILNVNGGVPEPATWAMMLLGFAGLAWAFRRRMSPVAAKA